MTDKETLIALAVDAETLKRVTKKYAYIGDLRYEFDMEGNICRVCEPIPGGNQQWREAK